MSYKEHCEIITITWDTQQYPEIYVGNGCSFCSPMWTGLMWTSVRRSVRVPGTRICLPETFTVGTMRCNTSTAIIAKYAKYASSYFLVGCKLNWLWNDFCILFRTTSQKRTNINEHMLRYIMRQFISDTDQQANHDSQWWYQIVKWIHDINFHHHNFALAS